MTTVFPPNHFHPLTWVVGQPDIGAGTWIGPFCVIDGSGGLHIGDGCDISAGAHVYSHSTVLRCVSGRQVSEVERRPTWIGDHVFIGPNATVLMGVRIGDGAVVGAGAVVTRDVPDGQVVAGVPAEHLGDVRSDQTGAWWIEHIRARQDDRTSTIGSVA